ncbi:MAG TPA: mercury resistance system transport protein MerF [Thermohalobaculum sp.]|nr:mercury resistance system transport protein MerF [Thermohalobaculum sp.]
MPTRRMLRTGIIGSAVTALCCVTPVPVLLLGAFGLTALVGWLDVVLLPALAGFLAMTGYALWKRRRERPSCARPSPAPNAATPGPK